MGFAAMKMTEGNEARAARMGLKPAPTLAGYFFAYKDCVENLTANLERTGRGEPPRFRQMLLETLNACNLRCPMCYTNAEGKDGKVKNEFLEWKRAVEAGRLAGVEAIAVAGCGEPLMDPDFWRLAELVRGNGIKLLVFTNGTFVTPDMARKLKANCDTVVTKLFAIDPKVHDVLVGVKGEHIKTTNSLIYLLEAGFEAPHLAVDAVLTKQNKGELGYMLRLCRGLNVIPYFERLSKIGKAKNLNGNMVLAQEEADAVFEELRNIDEREFGLTWVLTPQMPALAHAETDKRMVSLHMDVYGNVQPGLATGRIMGNIRNTEGGMAEIIRNAPAWHAYYNEVAKEAGLGLAGARRLEKIKEMRKIAFDAAMVMTSGGRDVHEHKAPDVNGGFKIMDFKFWTTEMEGAVALDGKCAAILRTVHEPVGESGVRFHLKLFKVMPDGRTLLVREAARLNDFRGRGIAEVGQNGIAVDFFGERLLVGG
jgi:MoaA/NifB/PqqE/SkfB family radical SAM enzyme